jgi:4-carboxymuconolactone decarboxylase
MRTHRNRTLLPNGYANRQKGGKVMYLPKIYENFSKEYPDVFKDFKKLGVSCRAAGPLDKKIQNLTKLGIALGVNSRGGVMSATRKALDSGATREEILHVVMLGLTTTGFPNMIAAFGWVEEVISKTGS